MHPWLLRLSASRSFPVSHTHFQRRHIPLHVACHTWRQYAAAHAFMIVLYVKFTVRSFLRRQQRGRKLNEVIFFVHLHLFCLCNSYTGLAHCYQLAIQRCASLSLVSLHVYANSGFSVGDQAVARTERLIPETLGSMRILMDAVGS